MQAGLRLVYFARLKLDIYRAKIGTLEHRLDMYPLAGGEASGL